MYIRQVTFISFEEIIQFQPETRLEMAFSKLDISILANALRKPSNSRGPKGYDAASLIYALLAMQAIPLIEQFIKIYRNIIHPLHYVMDSGYDFENTYKEIVSKYNGLPIIAYNPRGSYAPPEGLDENFDPVCSAGYKLIYWGKDGDYLKFRCPPRLSPWDDLVLYIQLWIYIKTKL